MDSYTTCLAYLIIEPSIINSPFSPGMIFISDSGQKYQSISPIIE